MIKNNIVRILHFKILQKIWEKVDLWCLKLMNFSYAGDFKRSGEKWLIDSFPDILNKEVNDKFVIFDVGANIGIYTEYVLNKYKNDVDIYSFEPLNANFQTLENKFSEFKNVKLTNIGFGNSNERIEIYYPKDHTTLASVYNRNLESHSIEMDTNENIEIQKIDTFCYNNKINNIHLLKLDIEGHEFPALIGASKLISEKSIDIIQFEFGGCNIDSKTFFKDFYYLLKDKYKIYRLLTEGVYEIENYNVIHERFITTNYIAVSRELESII